MRVRRVMHCQGIVHREKLAAGVWGQPASPSMGRQAKRTVLARGRRRTGCASDGQEEEEEGIRAAEIRATHESSGCNHGTSGAAAAEALSGRVCQAWPGQE